MKPTRRQFMATSAVVGAGALAGCSLDQIPFIGGGGLGQYPDWVPAEGTLAPESDDESSQGIGFGASNPSSINGSRNKLHPNRYRQLQESYDATGVAWKSLKMDLSFRNGAVYSGSFDAETVKSELTDDSGGSTEYTEDGSSNGYDIYVQTEEAVAESTGLSEDAASTDYSSAAYAVSGNTIVQASRVGFSPGGFNEDPSVDISAAEAAETIIDAGENGNDRAIDDSDDFQTLTNELNNGDRVFGRLRDEEIDSDEADAESGDFEGLIASGSSLSINGDNSKRQIVLVFDSSGDADEGDVNDWVEAQDTNGGTWQYYRDTSVNVSDNVVTITGTIDTYDLGR